MTRAAAPAAAAPRPAAGRDEEANSPRRPDQHSCGGAVFKPVLPGTPGTRPFRAELAPALTESGAHPGTSRYRYQTREGAAVVQVCNAGCIRPASWAGYCSWHSFMAQQQRRGQRPTVAAALLARLRRHIHALIDAGVPEAQIALDAGLNRRTIQWVSSGRAEAGVPPGYRISPQQADRVLALAVPHTLHEGVADTAPVAGVGTVRRLRALVAAGHPAPVLAGHLTLDLAVVETILEGRIKEVPAGVARAAADLFSRLQMVVGACEDAKRAAAARRWAPPLAWDEERLDEPDAGPERTPRRRVGFVEAYTELRMLGFSDVRIADRMGVQAGSLLRQIMRYNLTPSAELVSLASSQKCRAQKKAS